MTAWLDARHRLSRRQVLKLAGAGPIAAALTSVPSIGARQPAPGGAPLRLWWWGEPVAAGISRWVEDTLSRFSADSGLQVEPTYLATDQVVEGFTSAAAAGVPPDVAYLWNGSYHMENVWRGYVEPLNGMVSRNVLHRSGATRLSSFEGKQYRAGFFAYGYGLAFNKVLFDRAGLNADDPPRTWDAFLNACERLKAAGVIPLGGGAKDGYFGDWYLSNTLTQNLNVPGEAIRLFIGDLDWREPRYHEHWVRLQELHRLGFFNEDISTLEHFEALGQFADGRFAMCINATSQLSVVESRLGRGNLGFVVMPVFGRGRMAGVPIVDADGFGIPHAARDPRNAARFIEYMHTKERLQAMWRLSRQIPSDEAFDPSVIDDPFIKQVYDVWMAGPHLPYIGDLMPTPFWTDVMFVASQRILAGGFSGEDAAELAFRVTEAWKVANSDTVSNYARWSHELGL
jgi:raffinose/stachyose/melibiose transport system substrate-binding protein